MNAGFPPPYQNSVVSTLPSDQLVRGVQQENPGSVLKPVAELKEAAGYQSKAAPQVRNQPNAQEQDEPPLQSTPREPQIQGESSQRKQRAAAFRAAANPAVIRSRSRSAQS